MEREISFLSLLGLKELIKITCFSTKVQIKDLILIFFMQDCVVKAGINSSVDDNTLCRSGKQMQ